MQSLNRRSSVVSGLRADIERSAVGAKRLKLRTLLAKFGYTKRSDSNTAEITRLLSEAGLAMNPPIVRFGDSWEITPEDWIYTESGKRLGILECGVYIEESSAQSLPLPSSGATA